jgi:hypothetical protein
MKAKPYTLLLHPAFLTSLVVLLLNDFYLKYAFPNELTGKLSDVAGLFAFAVFLFVFFPSYKKQVIIFCVLFFCWWKSPLSNSFIQGVNDQLSLPLYRVIDYTDLFALLVLPLAYRIKAPAYSTSLVRSVAVYATGIISFFSFCATSMMPRQLAYYNYRENEVNFDQSFNTAFSTEELLEKLNPQKLPYTMDSVRFYKIQESGEFYQHVTNRYDTTSQWIPIKRSDDTTLFIRKPDQQFYILPYYLFEGDTLSNLEFSFGHNGTRKKPTTVRIRTFQAKNHDVYVNLLYPPGSKRLRKHFKRLFHK